MEVAGHSQNDNTLVVNAITNQDSKLDTIASNTANIKASIEVGGDLHVTTDGLETLQTSANNTLSSIDNKVILPSVLNSDQLKVNDSAVIGSLATMNNNFHSQTDFLDASVNVLTNPPTSAKLLLTQDIPLQFQMETNNNSLGDIATAISTTNSTLANIDNDTGNMVSLQTAGNNTHSANNTLLAGILNGLSENSDGTGTFAGANLQSIKSSLTSIDSKTSDTHSKIDSMRGSNSLTDLATKLNAGLPSSLDGDRLKVLLDANLSDTNSKIDAMRGSNSITDLATKLNAGLPSSLDSDRLKVSLDANLSDTNSKIV